VAEQLDRQQHDGRSRLIAAAIELIAQDGHRAATVRRVAEAAGVSAPLVLHHFGSKKGLIDACDAQVREIIDAVVARVAEAGVDGSFREILADQHAAVALMYIGRALHDDAEMGRAWFDGLYELALASTTEMQSAGLVRDIDDLPMAAALMLAMDLGMVLLRPHVERAIGVDLTDPEAARRWAAAEFDLFTRPLFTPTETT
jgi:AcrR family transcriptional regulator